MPDPRPPANAPGHVLTPEERAAYKSYKVNRVEYKLRLTPSLAEHIRRHAFERGVSRQELMADVLTAWVVVMTDPENGLYNPVDMGVAPLQMPPERRPGYVTTLGFTLTEDGELDHQSPQVVRAVAYAPQRLLPHEAAWADLGVEEVDG